MSESIDIYEPYILNEKNIEEYLKYKKKNEIRVPINKIIKPTIKKSDIFIPKEYDTLFWCYYIILNGFVSYETLINKNTLLAKQFKIKYVDLIRENKQLLKTYKFDTITGAENNLVNDDNINIKTVMSLCAINNINLFFVSRNTYCEIMMNDSDKIYVIREIQTNQNYRNNLKKYGFELINSDGVNEIKNTLYKIDNINKPIKGLSSYKVQELIDIAIKLGIEIKNNETGKNKSKNELYESIILYF